MTLLLMMMLSSQDFLTAVKAGDTKAVQEMLAKDPALAAAKDKDGVPALLAAVFRSQKSIAELILATGIPLDVFEAATFGRTDRVRDLITKDPSLLNACAPYGFFPLGLAAFFGHKDTVEALIAAGADVNLQSRESMKVSALHSAAAAGRLDIVQLLLDHGANPNLKAESDFRVLHEAAARGNLELAAVLLKAGADINAMSADGKTPLAFALEHKKEEMAAFLRSRGGM
jgi:ankyrin repeat protein